MMQHEVQRSVRRAVTLAHPPVARVPAPSVLEAQSAQAATPEDPLAGTLARAVQQRARGPRAGNSVDATAPHPGATLQRKKGLGAVKSLVKGNLAGKHDVVSEVGSARLDIQAKVDDLEQRVNQKVGDLEQKVNGIMKLVPAPATPSSKQVSASDIAALMAGRSEAVPSRIEIESRSNVGKAPATPSSKPVSASDIAALLGQRREAVQGRYEIETR